MLNISDEVLKYETGHCVYIVIHDFNKIGSAVKGYTRNELELFSEIISRCNRLAKSPIQVIRVGGPKALSTWSEYAPYTIVEDDFELVKMVVTGECPGEPNRLITCSGG